VRDFILTSNSLKEFYYGENTERKLEACRVRVEGTNGEVRRKSQKLDRNYTLPRDCGLIEISSIYPTYVVDENGITKPGDVLMWGGETFS
jgi:hypothetical protein